MSKRKVQFAENEKDETEIEIGAEGADHAPRFKGKHSLDSDEEDTDDKTDHYNVLADDDIEGQEDATIDCDQGVQITPFNMTEELEEGHFDKSGMYIFDKDKDNIQDHWMDNIDWVRVKEKSKGETTSAGNMDDNDSDSSEEFTDINRAKIYEKMIELVKPGENIAKALRRLGGSSKSMSASQRWKVKKQKMAGSDSKGDNPEDKEMFLKLTGLADDLVSAGQMDIYEATYEKLVFMLKALNGENKKTDIRVPSSATDDDALDMFADNIDDKTEPTKTENKGDNSTEKKNTPTGDSELMWEYKKDDTEEAELHGPYTSPQMLAWAEEGRFSKGVMCRKTGSGSQFYSAARIDFDLYT